MEVRKIVRHKWVVPVAALILVLSIGAGAWAATDTTGTTPSTDGSTAPSTDGDTEAYCDPGESGFGGRGHMRGFAGDDGARDEARQNMRGYMQERLESYVDSVRGQMSTADQQKLDTLLDQLETERESLQKAADEVRDTMQELRDLIDQYDAPASDSSSGSSDGTSGATVTPAPSGTSTVYQ